MDSEFRVRLFGRGGLGFRYLDLDVHNAVESDLDPGCVTKLFLELNLEPGSDYYPFLKQVKVF